MRIKLKSIELLKVVNNFLKVLKVFKMLVSWIKGLECLFRYPDEKLLITEEIFLNKTEYRYVKKENKYSVFKNTKTE